MHELLICASNDAFALTFAQRAIESGKRCSMTEKTIDLDQHRGMAAAQKATELRRLMADVEANEEPLRSRQHELEAHMLAAPARNWPEAAEKARYLPQSFCRLPGRRRPPHRS